MSGLRAAALLFAACMALATPTRQAAAAAPEHVTVRLDWLPRAYQGSLYLAAKEGYYKDEGLDVEIFDGKGTLATIQAIAAGTDTIGMASLADAAVAVTKDIPILAIACIIQKDPDAIISLQGSGITKPKDIEGKRMGFVPASNADRAFKGFVAANNIDTSKITSVQLGPGTDQAMLLAGNVDFIAAWASTDAVRVARQKPIEPPLVFADYGVNTLATGLIVTRETAEQRGAMLRAFLKATVHAADDAAKNPDLAIDAILSARPNQDRAILIEENNRTQQFLHTVNSQGHGFGWMAPADWAQTVDLLKKYVNLPSDFKVGDLYTNQFLPKQ